MPATWSDRTRLSKLLDKTAEEDVDILASCIVGEDGLLVCSSTEEPGIRDSLSTMAAVVFAIGDKTATELKQGNLSHVIMDAELGSIVIMRMAGNRLIAALVRKGANLGLVLTEMSRASKRIAEVLGEEVIEGLPAATLLSERNLWLIELARQGGDQDFSVLFDRLVEFAGNELRRYKGLRIHSLRSTEVLENTNWSSLCRYEKCDGKKIATMIASALRTGTLSRDIKVCITDVELDPGPKYNYRLFSRLAELNAFVMSIKPLDPHYWNKKMENRCGAVRSGDRNEILFKRARSALIRLISTVLGLKVYCLRPYCYLYGNLDSDPDPILMLGKTNRLCEYHITELLSALGKE